MQALLEPKMMNSHRVQHWMLTALLLWAVFPTGAQLQETIGFEFEDYLHAWPDAYPPHEVTLLYPEGGNEYPPIRIRYDDRSGYKDLEVHLGPFEQDSLPEGLFQNYLDFYREIIQAAEHSEEVEKPGWYKYKAVKTFIVEENEYLLALVTEFLKSGIPNKTDPPNPTSDVGPQATFSLDARKAYAFFRDAPNNPFFYSHTVELIDQLDRIDGEYGTVKDCLELPENKRTPYGCSLRGRGFAYFLAVYLADTIRKVNSLGADGGEIKKESYPLYLRNIEADINAVKEYFLTVAGGDEVISSSRGEFISELKGILPQALPELKEETGMNTAGLVSAYLDFIGGPQKTGFEYGPRDEYGIPRYIFSTLSEAQEAVISHPKSDSAYFEIRNMRNKYVRYMGKNPRTYAIPYEIAVSFSQRSLEYLVEFNQHWEDTH